MEANALYGNAHYNLANLVIDKGNITISENSKNAFLSSVVYADIGRFEFDKKPVLIPILWLLLRL